MATSVTLAADVAEKLEKRTAIDGRTIEALANDILRNGLEGDNATVSPVDGQNALEGLSEFIGKFDSGNMDPSDLVRSTDSYEEAFGEALLEKYRRQGLQL